MLAGDRTASRKNAETGGRQRSCADGGVRSAIDVIIQRNIAYTE